MTGATDGTLNHGIVLGNMADVTDAPSLVELGVAAEDAGWDGVFLTDHFVYPPEKHQAGSDPWITLSGIATRTDRITLGSWVTPVPRRQPWQLARDLATLDRLSDGRVILGAGLGVGPDYTTFGRSFDMRTVGHRYDEALDVITGLWRGEPFSYEGEHFAVDEAVMLPTPVQEPRIPIATACWWPNRAPFHRGARWDGIMPSFPSIYGGAGPHGEQPTGTPEEEVHQLVEYYRGLTDEPGAVFLPIDFPDAPPDIVDTCRDLDIAWTITTTWDESRRYNPTLARVREGPPDR